MNMVRANRQIILERLIALSIASLLACMLTSCGMKEESAPAPAPAPEPAPAPASAPAPAPAPEATSPTPIAESQTPPTLASEKYSEGEKQGVQPEGSNKSAKRTPAAADGVPKGVPADDYKVKLGADPVLRIPGPPGELKVWIGLPAYEPEYKDMNIESDTLPAEGKTAMVTPFAPGLKVEPNKSICMKTNPKGSEVRFTLTPIESGSFKVGADVALFDSNDCSGSPIPKATTTLRVDVSVDPMKVTVKYAKELWEIFWKKLLEFWGAAVALFFAALLFLFRKKLKKWFGFTG